ncbi:MAG: hypothetical protein V7637_6287, partial [Mycobacteriales bacterium]
MGTRADDAAGREEFRHLSRRRFLAGSAGVAAGVSALSLGPLAPTAYANGRGHESDHGHDHNDRDLTVAPKRRGIILYTVRDVLARTPNPALGLGGGFRYTLEQISAMGYHEVEFAGYTQATSILGRQITAAEIRQLLDDNGLKANGSHITFDFANPASFEAQLDIAETLGMPHLGTPNIPTGSRYKADWQAAAENFNA